MHSHFVQDSRRRFQIKARNHSELHAISVLICKAATVARSLRDNYLKPGIRQVGTEPALVVGERRRGDLPPPGPRGAFFILFPAGARARPLGGAAGVVKRAPQRSPPELRCGDPVYPRAPGFLRDPFHFSLLPRRCRACCDAHATSRDDGAGTFVHACAEGFTPRAAVALDTSPCHRAMRCGAKQAAADMCFRQGRSLRPAVRSKRRSRFTSDV